MQNNPITGIDPDGHFKFDVEGQWGGMDESAGGVAFDAGRGGYEAYGEGGETAHNYANALNMFQGRTSPGSGLYGTAANSNRFEFNSVGKFDLLGRKVGISVEASIEEAQANPAIFSLRTAFGLINSVAGALQSQEQSALQSINRIDVHSGNFINVAVKTGVINFRPPLF